MLTIITISFSFLVVLVKVSLDILTNVYEDIGSPNVLGRSLELNSKLENIELLLNLHVCIKKICGPTIYTWSSVCDGDN